MDIMKLMKQAGQLKKMQGEIKNRLVNDTINGASLTISGAGELKGFSLSQKLYDQGKDALEKNISAVISSCLKKQLELQKDMAKEALGGMNIPGL